MTPTRTEVLLPAPRDGRVASRPAPRRRSARRFTRERTVTVQADRLRRLLVSPDGVAHAPNCRGVRATAEAGAWGELGDVAAALRELAARVAVPSLRAGRLTPGPVAQAVCRRCLGETVSSVPTH